MRLKNKKTGEIAVIRETIHLTKENDICCGMGSYNSLTELNEEWEDYEEPKKNYWYIDGDGETYQIGGIANITKSQMVNIGNYFETKEEAEKAVEKLKALAEAKEDGLKIKGYYYNHEDLVILADIGKCNKLTLDTLFGKEID